jgi:hypothetical protein
MDAIQPPPPEARLQDCNVYTLFRYYNKDIRYYHMFYHRPLLPIHGIHKMHWSISTILSGEYKVRHQLASNRHSLKGAIQLPLLETMLQDCNVGTLCPSYN